MSDKTRLELDLESRERYKTSLGAKALIVLLIAGLIAAGLYTFKLRQELSQKNQYIITLKEDCRKEKDALSARIRQTEAGPFEESNKD